jgi:SprT protein
LKFRVFPIQLTPFALPLGRFILGLNMPTSLTKELHQRVMTRLEECISQASVYFKQSYPVPSLNYKLRGKAAGKAYLQLWEVRLNPVLLRENPDLFFNEVIAHEVAHLVTFHRYGRVRPHGKEWKSVMSGAFKLAPKATHSMDVTSVQGKTFDYRCQCNKYALSIRRHNKVLRQQASYRCQKCGDTLRYLPSLTN